MIPYIDYIILIPIRFFIYDIINCERNPNKMCYIVEKDFLSIGNKRFSSRLMLGTGKYRNFLEAKEILTKLKIPFEAHAIDNLDHSIDIRAVRIGQQFIKSLI